MDDRPAPAPVQTSVATPRPRATNQRRLQAPPRFEIQADMAPGAESLPDLAWSLFGCAPPDLRALPPEDRARCHALPDGTASDPALDDPFATTSHVHDARRWADALAHRRSPRLLPGASPTAPHIDIWSSNPDADTFLRSVKSGGMSDPDSSAVYETGR